jgi:hypothetical protein
LIEINWHELRVLGIWASNYANEHCDDANRLCLRGIVSRLERQAPGQAPLTLGGELRLVRELQGFKIKDHNFPEEGLALANGPGAVGFSQRPTRVHAPEGQDPTP